MLLHYCKLLCNSNTTFYVSKTSRNFKIQYIFQKKNFKSLLLNQILLGTF